MTRLAEASPEVMRYVAQRPLVERYRETAIVDKYDISVMWQAYHKRAEIGPLRCFWKDAFNDLPDEANITINWEKRTVTYEESFHVRWHPTIFNTSKGWPKGDTFPNSTGGHWRIKSPQPGPVINPYWIWVRPHESLKCAIARTFSKRIK